MGRGRIKAEPGDPNNSIATRIRTAMAACGMKSVAELGRRIGLPRQTVHRWINGDTKNMTHENLYKVADALQVQELVVITWTHDPAARRRSYELLAREFF